jgi:predicted transcriptional regulator
MQHKGEIVEKAIRESGYPITKLASKLGRSRRWMYHVFDNPNVSIDYILAIGKIIHHDFYSEINELKVQQLRNLNDLPNNYDANEENPLYWKNKYFNLLEEYHTLLKKNKEN